MKVGNIVDFRKEIKKKDYALFFVIGEQYSQKNAIEFLKDLKKEYQVLSIFDENASELPSLLTSYDFFSPKKIFVVYQYSQYEKNIKKTIKDIVIGRKFNKDYKILFISDKMPFKFVDTTDTLIAEFRTFYENDLPDWIKSYVRKHSLEITDEAISLLIFVYGNDRDSISSELERFIELGDKKVINVEDIIATGGRKDAIFQIIKSIYRGDIKKTLSLFYYLQEKDMLIHLLNRDFMILSIIKSLGRENARKLLIKMGIKKFLLNNYFLLEKKISYAKLVSYNDEVLEWEKKIKTGFRTLETGICYIYKLTKGRKV